MYADDASGIEARLSHALLRKKNASTKHNALRKNQERKGVHKAKGQHPRWPPTQSNRYCGVLFFIGLFSAFTIFTEATSIWPVLASAVPIICT